MAELEFDATVVDPNQPFEVLPAGKYKVQIVASEMRATKDGGGQYLWLEEEILDGEYQGRKLWDRLNLQNPNQQSVDIAQRTLSALCHAVGELHVSDSEQLHFHPIIATVRVRPAGKDKQGIDRDASNEIRGYESVGDVKPAVVARAAVPQSNSEGFGGGPAAPAAATKQPPWRTAKSA